MSNKILAILALIPLYSTFAIGVLLGIGIIVPMSNILVPILGIMIIISTTWVALRLYKTPSNQTTT